MAVSRPSVNVQSKRREEREFNLPRLALFATAASCWGWPAAAANCTLSSGRPLRRTRPPRASDWEEKRATSLSRTKHNTTPQATKLTLTGPDHWFPFLSIRSSVVTFSITRFLNYALRPTGRQRFLHWPIGLDLDSDWIQLWRLGETRQQLREGENCQ